MPCRDYESDNYDYSAESARMKKQADRLARIACKAMEELERNGIEDMLLLKDDEVRDWWQKHKEADRKEKARIAEKERKERVRAEALARLSDEEQELLGLKPKTKAIAKATATKSYVRKDGTFDIKEIEDYAGYDVTVLSELTRQLEKSLQKDIDQWEKEDEMWNERDE